ncbi:M20 family metallopeptidase [Alkalihalobacillus sp. 1P02AB]|uniref:M20 family metallopeptidase n=1 Tax=Alkalihalobacillus sp. 1P02AB TaxID=3132260 RepID=UPI0039A47E3C
MELAKKIEQFIEENKDLYTEISDQIWDYAETNYLEYKSAELLASTLEKNHFRVTRGAGDIPTAFVAEYGQGSPVIAILGEYDALFYLSQEPGLAYYKPVEKGGNGHGCGHNLLGTAGVTSVLAIKKWLQEEGISGTIRYYGCPAEEGGAGKVHMVNAGLFKDVDLAISWHPATVNSIISRRMIATNRIYYTFKGRASHAGASPHLGRSALDAVELMNIGANYLREHLIDDTRLHYAITNAGGNSPNVVQHEAQVQYVLRGPNIGIVHDMVDRVTKIAEGAAMMTETSVERYIDSGTSDLIPNKPLEELMHKCFQELGTPSYTEEERAFAKQIRSTLSPEEKVSSFDLFEDLLPYEYDAGYMHGSSDVGDVSWTVPTAQCTTACLAMDTTLHTWQVVSQGRTSVAHKGMLQAGKVMALTAARLYQEPDVIAAAKVAHHEELKDKVYICPIPDGIGLPDYAKEKKLISTK